MEEITKYIFVIIAFVIGIVLHELAHAYSAYKLGDYTIKESGRLTLNPLKHLDPFGTLALLILGFGWAKPVQIDPHYFKDKTKGIFIVSLAGPMTNFAISMISYIMLILIMKMNFYYEPINLLLFFLFRINLVLFILNLIPIPPLDGSKLLIKVMDRESFQNFQNNQFLSLFFLITLLATGIFEKILGIIETPFIEYLLNI